MLTSHIFFEKAFVDDLRTLKTLEKYVLVKKFWPETNVGRGAFDDFSCGAIVEYIADELDRVRHHGQLFAAQNFESTFAIIETLKEAPSIPYEQVVRDLLARFPDATPEAIRRSVELSTRMWLTINTHTSDVFVGPISAGDTPIDWAEDISLEQLLRQQFGRRIQTERQRGTSKVDPAFTAVYLVNTCGMRLRWTDDIAAHLSFDLKRIVLTVYRHKACLVSHLSGRRSCPIPKDVLEEVLDTMDLLFPPWDVATQSLLRKEGQQSLYTLGCRKSTRSLDMADYHYFGEELEHIFESFNKTPRTWKQLALDRRNKLEWSAFWVTVMVGFLTLVSIPCNIIQAMYSVKAYHATVAQGNFGQRKEL